MENHVAGDIQLPVCEVITAINHFPASFLLHSPTFNIQCHTHFSIYS